MSSCTRSRQRLARREEGVALLVTLMVLMLVSALMVGFVAAIIADTRASGLDRDQTQAYAASHAGLEQITSDLATLFVTDFSPSTAQIAALRATPPVLPGFTFIAPGGGAGSGYWVQPRFTDPVTGNPRPEDLVNGSAITAGPYQGFRGIITPYDITVTARSTAPPALKCGCAAPCRRSRFRCFSSACFPRRTWPFTPAPKPSSFGGRVHTNGNLFLAAANGGSLTIADRITAVKDVIRTHLPNGLAHHDRLRRGTCGFRPRSRTSRPTTCTAISCGRKAASPGPSLPFRYRSRRTNGGWVGLSQGTYQNNIRNGDTGAKLLSLPLVADLDNSGAPDAEPIELIRRPGQGSNENAGTTAQRNVYSQRFFALASVRILLSDTAAEITSLPTVTATRRWRSADRRSPALYPVLRRHRHFDAAPVSDRHSDGPGAIAGPAGGPAARIHLQGQSRRPVAGRVHQDRNPKAARCGPGADRGRVAGRDR